MGEKRTYLDEGVIRLLSLNRSSVTVVQLFSDEPYGLNHCYLSAD